MLSIYFAEAVLITLLASAILLLWYRRSVSRSMRATPSLSARVAPAGSSVFAGTDPVLPTTAPRDGVRDVTPSSAAARLRLRLVVVYGAAGSLAAAVLAKLFLISLGETPRGLQVFVTWYANCWPLVPTYAALLALSRKTALLICAVYVSAGAVIVLVWSLVALLIFQRMQSAPLGNVYSYLVFLFLQSWAPFLVIVMMSVRRLRSVSAFVLAGLLVFSFSNFFISQLFALGLDHFVLRQLVALLGAWLYLASWFMLAALPIGYLCWRFLCWLSRAHERKAFSDVQLVVDSWWLIAVFFVTTSLATDFGWGALVALVAFAAYRAVVALGLYLWPVGAASHSRNRLLLLRVFGFQRRTERLFDAIAQRWRLSGSVKLIAAADLAARVIDPADIIAFIGGRMRDRFVADDESLGRQLSGIDETPDPDGRFRVNKFFCHDVTWRAALQGLLRRSDVVLMDLRGFSHTNSGCVHELRELARTGLLPRSVLVVDVSTDIGLLEATLREAGAGVAAPSVVRFRSRAEADLWRARERLEALVQPSLAEAAGSPTRNA
jgi:hypothetical protein